ncbi:GNAT family N-acetyltransferase [Falsirhodobacter deserti]|uniref:GNAT family N-acetyltransferase n=1 Tax=Falsirhodobacter deserti TaxID=1365611 RepID=UPI000FE3A9C1|nr:GNAT family N-acetyltransferase [Falsirhodobacter deserti]
MIGLSNTPVLETERLILRAPIATDYPVFAEFYASERTQHMGGPLDAAKAWRAFGHIIGHWAMRGFGMFTITDRTSGAALGMTGAWFPHGWPEQEVGWSLWSAEHEGKGIAAEAARAALQYVWTVLQWDTAVSYVDTANTSSAALAARLGAVIDPQAVKLPVDVPLDVWRHTKPEGLA